MFVSGVTQHAIISADATHFQLHVFQCFQEGEKYCSNIAIVAIAIQIHEMAWSDAKFKYKTIFRTLIYAYLIYIYILKCEFITFNSIRVHCQGVCIVTYASHTRIPVDKAPCGGCSWKMALNR